MVTAHHVLFFQKQASILAVLGVKKMEEFNPRRNVDRPLFGVSRWHLSFEELSTGVLDSGSSLVD